VRKHIESSNWSEIRDRIETIVAVKSFLKFFGIVLVALGIESYWYGFGGRSLVEILILFIYPGLVFGLIPGYILGTILSWIYCNRVSILFNDNSSEVKDRSEEVLRKYVATLSNVLRTPFDIDIGKAIVRGPLKKSFTKVDITTIGGIISGSSLGVGIARSKGTMKEREETIGSIAINLGGDYPKYKVDITRDFINALKAVETVVSASRLILTNITT